MQAKNLMVGDTVFEVPDDIRNKPRTVEVIAVGRIWITLKNGNRIKKTDTLPIDTELVYAIGLMQDAADELAQSEFNPERHRIMRELRRFIDIFQQRVYKPAENRQIELDAARYRWLFGGAYLRERWMKVYSDWDNETGLEGFSKLIDAAMLTADKPASVTIYKTSAVGKSTDLLAQVCDSNSFQQIEQDAARYRKLRSLHWSDGPLAVVAEPKDSIKLGCYCPSKELLDQAVDALIQLDKGIKPC